MARKKLMRIYLSEDVTVMNIGEMETWDGADLVRLRESFLRIHGEKKLQTVGIDMSHVKAIQSGFFGMLFDWHEKGVQIRLYSPQPNVRRMMWFSRFFEAVADDCYVLCPNSAVIPLEDPVAASITGGHELIAGRSHGPRVRHSLT